MQRWQNLSKLVTNTLASLVLVIFQFHNLPLFSWEKNRSSENATQVKWVISFCLRGDFCLETWAKMGRSAEVGNISTYVHWHLRLNKISWKSCLLLYWLLVTKNNFFLTCTTISSLLNSFDLPSYSSESRKRCTLRLLLICLEALERGFPCFPERLSGGLVGVISCKVKPVDLNTKFSSKFNYSSTNCGCLPCAFLKALYRF